MTLRKASRRQFIAGSTVAAAGLASAPAARADGPFSVDFPFEIQRTREEWRALLTDEEYNVLREGWTEPRHSSELVNETRPGTYHCKGSGLAVYSHVNKVQLDIGWVFFRHSIPDAVLLGIDGPPPELNDAGMLRQDEDSIVEVHCRMSGSHLGHIVVIDGELIHCINGVALEFVPEAA